MDSYNDGPCYDYCACKWCWNGWITIPKLSRIINRIHYVVTNNYTRLKFTDKFFIKLSNLVWKCH